MNPDLIEFRKNSGKCQHPHNIFRNVHQVASGELINEDENKQGQAVVVGVHFSFEKKIDLCPKAQEQSCETKSGKRFGNSAR